MPRCYAQGPDCDGRLEEHHIIKRQRIRRRWQTLKAEQRWGGPKPWPITKALADPRGLIWACKRKHHVEESAVPLPDGFWDYVAEYDFEALLPRWLKERTAA